MIGSLDTTVTTYYSNAEKAQVSTLCMEHPRIMSFRNNCTKFSLRLAAVALVTVVAGCSSNKPANDATSYSASAATSSQTSAAPSYASSASTASQSKPVLQQVNSPVPLAEGAPNEYVVQVGDTLWDIAATFLKDPWYWPEIWYVNPEIENPHLIYPGDVLGLVTIDGTSRITNVRTSTYRLSPQARITPLTETVNSVPFDAIASFLSVGTVLEKNEVDALPYIVASRGEHLITAAGNSVYVRGADGAAAGTRFNIIHMGDKIVDPDDNDVLGYHGLLVGKGTLRVSGDPGTFALTTTNREIREGDRLIPEIVNIPLNYFPKAPSSPIDGRIMAVVGGVTQIGQHQVVIVNRGTNHGLSDGDVLSVFQTGQKVDDRFEGGSVTLPDEHAGTMMIFKTYDRISYGLVMEATLPIHVLDTIRNPI